MIQTLLNTTISRIDERLFGTHDRDWTVACNLTCKLNSIFQAIGTDATHKPDRQGLIGLAATGRRPMGGALF